MTVTVRLVLLQVKCPTLLLSLRLFAFYFPPFPASVSFAMLREFQRLKKIPTEIKEFITVHFLFYLFTVTTFPAWFVTHTRIHCIYILTVGLLGCFKRK